MQAVVQDGRMQTGQDFQVLNYSVLQAILLTAKAWVWWSHIVYTGFGEKANQQQCNNSCSFILFIHVLVFVGVRVGHFWLLVQTTYCT